MSVSVTQVSSNQRSRFLLDLRQTIFRQDNRWLFALVLLGFFLRIYQIDQQSFWRDEISQTLAVQGDFVRTLLYVIRGQAAAAPLDYTVTYIVYHFISPSEGILRLPAVLWGTLSILVLYYLGRALFDKPTGYLAAFLLTILPLHVYYSREARFYSLSILMILLTLLTFKRAVDKNTAPTWRLFGVTNLLALYCHFYMPVIDIAMGAWLLWCVITGRQRRNILTAFLRTVVLTLQLFLLWLIPDLLMGYSNFGTAFTLPTLPDWQPLFSSPFFIKFSQPYYLDGAYVSDPVGTWWTVFAWAMITGGLLVILFRRRLRSRFIAHLALLLMGSLIGLASIMALDFVVGYFWAPRQFVLYTPLLVLSVAAVTIFLWRWLYLKITHNRPGLQMARRMVLPVVALFSLVTLWQPLSYVYALQKEDWRGVNRYLLGHMAPDEMLFSVSPEGQALYLPEMRQQIELLPSDAQTLSELARPYARVWLLFYTNMFAISPDVAQWIADRCPTQAPTGPGLNLMMCLPQKDVQAGQ